MGELDNAKLTPPPCCTYLLKQSDIPKVIGYAQLLFFLIKVWCLAIEFQLRVKHPSKMRIKLHLFWMLVQMTNEAYPHI